MKFNEPLYSITTTTGAFTTMVGVMLLDKFGPIVTKDIIEQASASFKKVDWRLSEIEAYIYDQESLNEFIVDSEINVYANDADSSFIKLGFTKQIKDHQIIYEYGTTDDWQIAIRFNMLEKTYQHYRIYREGIDTDYDIETPTVLAIYQFMVEQNFFDASELNLMHLILRG